MYRMLNDCFVAGQARVSRVPGAGRIRRPPCPAGKMISYGAGCCIGPGLTVTRCVAALTGSRRRSGPSRSWCSWPVLWSSPFRSATKMYVSGLVYLRPAQRTTAGYEPASGNYEWCPNSNLFHSAEAAVPGPQVTVLPGKCWPCPKRPNARGLVDDRHRFSAASAGAARATPAVWAAAQMHHRAGFRIADAVRYMSVHSWKQPDSQGHGGTSQPRK